MSRLLVVADASALINLEASQAFVDIVDERQYLLGVVDPQVWTEALYVRRPGVGGPVREKIDLVAHELNGRVARVTLETSELGDYVRFATQMDDGEAAGLAVAVTRGLLILADDRAVKRVIATEALPVQIITTPRMLREWSGTQPADRIRDTLRNVEAFGSYVPPVSDPDYGWWMTARS